MAPILRGIRHLSVGKPVHLEETGELAEINAGLNKAGDYLLKKDNTRADWIRGISHDIRTPLSVILGYASEIEDTSSLPEAVRNQAGIIRRHSERLKDLVADLNLSTKLEYSMQPMQKQSLDPIELARQVVSEVLNDGLSEPYELELSEDNPGKNISILGDQVLLNRMLNNLIRNCIVHNPNGCKIQISVGSNDASCTFSVMDNGHGVSELQLNALNSDEDISSTQKQTDEAEHGLGLKIVRQIVKAHHGDVLFSGAIPHGLIVSIHLPMKL
nr:MULTISPECIES: HAMP domain-containing sensor histidine kinase [Blautia]